MVASSGSVSTAAVLACIYLYAQLQSGGGYIAQQGAGTRGPTRRQRSFRSWLASSALARRSWRFHMRDGSRVRSRIVDGGALLSVHVDGDYDVPGVNWSAAHTIVDIGAHVGSFTVWAALRSPKAQLLAVEPNPETFELLARNIRGNGLDDRVRAVNSALGAEEGIGSLELITHSLGTRLARTGSGQVRVRVQTMPGLLAEAGMEHVDVLKIDCEGMEYAVLEAMGPEGLRPIQVLACEYHPQPQHEVEELDALLRSAGFTVQRPNSQLGVLWATR